MYIERRPGKKKSILLEYLDEPEPVTDAFPKTPLPGGPAGHVVLRLADTPAPLSYNKTAGTHWAAQNADKLAWQRAACLAAKQAADELAPWRGHRVQVTIAIPVPDKRRRDSDNYYPSVVKPIKDGITKSGALWPDDNDTWCTALVVFWNGGTEVRIKVETAPEAWNPAA
jgi:Holliday junction resolvase RusA-like endonuclease